jgi:hypothetical protein
MIALLAVLLLVPAVPVLFRLPYSVLLNFFTGALRCARASRILRRADCAARVNANPVVR